jgi:antitoxin (DNA-binding transcriptional repressor) of toxin-antitoxin stability system
VHKGGLQLLLAKRLRPVRREILAHYLPRRDPTRILVEKVLEELADAVVEVVASGEPVTVTKMFKIVPIATRRGSVLEVRLRPKFRRRLQEAARMAVARTVG